jgi:uncharacterized membrane protein YdjX (TVP38/TMEM64 family)
LNDSGRLASTRRLVALAGILVLAGLVFFVIQREGDFASLAGLGYPGVAILMFFSSSTILFPAPGFAAVLAAGLVWNPLLVGLAAGVGSSTGELSGYLLGAGGSAVLDLKEAKRWARARGWLEKHGLLAIMALAAVPNPLFDVMGLVAGSLSYPVRNFWLACLLGNSIKYTAMAYLAYSMTGWWGGWFSP